jgi:2-polyprenyl-3-methyl-5-hydroxy-6-metoxy-1,4-benzoquinol methylase
VTKQANLEYPERLIPGTDIWQQGLADHIPRYEFAGNFCIGKRVLDAACGAGYGSKLLAERGATSIHAIDISEEALSSARKIFAHPRVSFQVDDCEKLSSVGDGIEVIIALECVEHLPTPEKFLNRCTDILDASGVLILSTPNAKALGRPKHRHPLNPYHIHEYTYQEFIELLERYFCEVKVYYQVKSRFLQLYEDVTRFVHSASRVSPLLRFLLWYRRKLMRPGLDPVIRPIVPSSDDYSISPTISDPDLAWVFIAVCAKPRSKSAKYAKTQVGLI